MSAVPAATPDTSPVAMSTTAMNISELDHTPPTAAFVNTALPPKHTVAGPPMAGGNGLTMTITVRLQPVGIV